MFPNLVPASSLFSLIVVLVLSTTHFRISFCDDDQQYVACNEQFQCGTIGDIGYPFSGQNRQAHCGHPGFPLTCQSDVPFLMIQNLSYRVLRIDTSAHVLRVAREDLWDTNCPETLHNTTLDFTLFNYGFRDQNISLHYDCSSLGTTPRILYQFDCNANQSSSGINIFTRTDPSLNTFNLLPCRDQLIVPVNQTSAEAIGNATASVSDLRAALTGGFELLWTADNALCNECVQSGGRCGSNSTDTTSFACYCQDRPYAENCNNRNGNDSTNNKATRIIGIASGGAGLIIVLCLLLFCGYRRIELRREKIKKLRREKMNDESIESFISNYGPLASKRFRYSEIKKMTNSFVDKLGQGGFGSVYKGKFSDGRPVAVKLLTDNKGDGEDFINEVASISRTSHVNVVSFLGFCFQGSKKALIYEFMPNGSLNNFISNADSSSNSNVSSRLGWTTLYQIALGIARGLEYLHRGCSTRIVHFDIKPHNILLDEDFCPKISDFGLAKLCQRKESIVSMLGTRGTIGYIAPEVFSRNFGEVSHKSDVYSYGMMVLEMAGARNKNEVESTSESIGYAPHWIYNQIERGETLRLCGVTSVEEEETARKMILVSLWCIQTNPSGRPLISKVVDMLEGDLQSLQIPPKPFVFSPVRLPQDSSASLPPLSDSIV